jgi:hypothetical protein
MHVVGETRALDALVREYSLSRLTSENADYAKFVLTEMLASSIAPARLA